MFSVSYPQKSNIIPLFDEIFRSAFPYSMILRTAYIPCPLQLKEGVDFQSFKCLLFVLSPVEYTWSVL